MSTASLPSQCSADALTSIQPVISALLSEVLNFIDSCGWAGCTDEEGQIATGIPGNTRRPCRLKLEKMGKVSGS